MMKKLFLKGVLLLAVSLSTNVMANILDGSFTGTFQGWTDKDEFKFKGNDGKTYIFQEISEDVDVDLYDDGYIGSSFEIEWEDIEEEVLDNDDEPTGETVKYKVIIGLEPKE